MTLFYVIVAGGVAWFIFTRIKYLIQRSPEQRQEEATYRELMNQVTEEASYYTGRPISEEDILAKGRKFGRRDSRHRKKR